MHSDDDQGMDKDKNLVSEHFVFRLDRIYYPYCKSKENLIEEKEEESKTVIYEKNGEIKAERYDLPLPVPIQSPGHKWPRPVLNPHLEERFDKEASKQLPKNDNKISSPESIWKYKSTDIDDQQSYGVHQTGVDNKRRPEEIKIGSLSYDDEENVTDLIKTESNFDTTNQCGPNEKQAVDNAIPYQLPKSGPFLLTSDETSFDVKIHPKYPVQTKNLKTIIVIPPIKAKEIRAYGQSEPRALILDQDDRPIDVI